jgi:diguanylate cyclase (GGDEF)-like protein
LSTAASLYRSERFVASSEARAIARELNNQTAGRTLSPAQLRSTVASLATQSGLVRVVVTLGSHSAVDVGDPTAIAPGSATVRARRITVVASELTAAQYVRELAPQGIVMLVREGGRVLAESGPNLGGRKLPTHGSITLNRATYRALSQALPGFGHSPVELTVLASGSAATRSVGESKVVALAFVIGFLLLAVSFAVWASRGLQSQVGRFLHAARRLAGGDFSSPIRIEGRDEFAALGEEFNNMSSQLAQRLGELSQERARLREAIRRIGQTLASNLDRPALLELALKTAIDAVRASGGRVTARSAAGNVLEESGREGPLDQVRAAVTIAERVALETGDSGEGVDRDWHAVSVPMGPLESGGRVHGLITVIREGEPFSSADRELLRSLGAQATLALENVDLHIQVSRQAITDDLTGLANHGHFQELLGAEVEQVRRYHHPLGLIMMDIDDFKSINDTYGHQQGDLVLKRVARVLADSSREVDYPARYGGEELAVILPHTDLDGAHAIAERIRMAIETLRVPRIDNQGMLKITASLGVATSTDGDKDALIAQADAALYEAKRKGKNRTVCSPIEAANVFTAE